VSIKTRRGSLACLATALVLAAALAGCANNGTGEALTKASPSPVIFPSEQTAVHATPTPIVLGPLFEAELDLWAGPVTVPLELHIPSLEIFSVPVLGVGLTADNKMDGPKGPIGDPIWSMAYWYRGGGNPGEPGTATIAGHVNDPLGRPEIFANLEDLRPGDLIIVRYTRLNINIRFIVDQVKNYSVEEASTPEMLRQIFGAGAVAGTGPQTSPDGLSHLTLITCAGNIVNGAFDRAIIVYATRSD